MYEWCCPLREQKWLLNVNCHKGCWQWVTVGLHADKCIRKCSSWVGTDLHPTVNGTNPGVTGKPGEDVFSGNGDSGQVFPTEQPFSNSVA